MKTYGSKEELIGAIQKSYEKYDQEFNGIPEKLKNQSAEGVDRTPSENLSYQIGWTILLLEWERAEAAGRKAVTPAEGFKWNRLGDLYQEFYRKYGSLSIKQQRTKLRENIRILCDWIESLSEQELFEPHQREWADSATSKAVWPVYKFIHVNTVAPFTNFRTKIRKWKKEIL